MEINILAKLSQEIKIAPEFIIREFWEMILLSEFKQLFPSDPFIFKGGTALRLAYNSPRFSEDLDFDLRKKISLPDFEKAVKVIINKYPELSLKDIADKHYTMLVQISLKETGLSRTFSIKIEISKRKIRPSGYYEPKLIISPTTSKQILINVAKLEEIEKEKRQAIKTRQQARDLFDLWYISQLKKVRWVCPKHFLAPAELKRELNKFLPKNYHRVIDSIYEKSRPIRKTK